MQRCSARAPLICGAAARRSSASGTTEGSSGIWRPEAEDDGRSIGYRRSRTIACKCQNLRGRAGGRSIAIAQNVDNAIAVAMIPRMASLPTWWSSDDCYSAGPPQRKTRPHWKLPGPKLQLRSRGSTVGHPDCFFSMFDACCARVRHRGRLPIWASRCMPSCCASLRLQAGERRDRYTIPSGISQP
jgi:hypothetical protein